MKRFFKATAAVCASVAIISGCAKQADTPTNENEKLYFDSWIQVHYPQLEKTGLGIYIIPEYEQTGEDSEAEPVADSQYVYVSYVARSLDGTITGYSEAETAKLVGDYSENSSTYYGPVVWTRLPGYLYAGVNEVFTGMGKGDSRRAIIPGWLMSYEWYGTEQQYIDKVTGTNAIYDIKVIEPINDIEQWQVDSLGRFFAGGYGEHDFKYITTDEFCGYLKENGISSAKDSSDMYGFYFIEINHGEELKPIESDSDEDTGEDDGYDWEKSHFYTTSGSNDTTIYINYVGRLLNGTVFDTNVRRVAQDNGLSGGTYEPVAIQWGDSYYELEMGDEGSSSSIIQGFAMTLWRMHPRGKAIGIFYSNLGYGYSGSGSSIPAYSPLMFEIEIVDDPDE